MSQKTLSAKPVINGNVTWVLRVTVCGTEQILRGGLTNFAKGEQCTELHKDILCCKMKEHPESFDLLYLALFVLPALSLKKWSYNPSIRHLADDTVWPSISTKQIP